jgi:hypothetical protein
VGYDKAAMVFHMLRRELGENVFWEALSEIYSGKLFTPVSWKDLHHGFEARVSGNLELDLEAFFNQWITRSGAPQLYLDGVRRESLAHGWQVSGRIHQFSPFYNLNVSLRIETQSGYSDHGVKLTDEINEFAIPVPAKPHKIELDPDVNIFRRLTSQEIPATINSLKGAPAVTLVLARDAGAVGRQSAQMLIRALGLTRTQIVNENDLKGAAKAGQSRIFIGLPANRSLLPDPPPPVQMTPQTISVASRHYPEPTDTFFGVMADPQHPDAVIALLAPLHPDIAPMVARKVTHYGKYSYLIFQNGQNREKGTWPVTTSPMIFQWDDLPNPNSNKG